MLRPALGALLLTLAACTSGAASGGSADSGTPGNIDQASLPRTPASTVPASVLSSAVAANNAFAFDLYGRVRTSPDAGAGNLWTSPLSASLALTMTYAGAQGQTATQMATALHLGSAPGSVFAGQNALLQALASRTATALASDTTTYSAAGLPAPSPSNYDLTVVNAVWGEQTYPWAQPFLDVLAQSYGTGVHLEDFEHQWAPARLAINAWVSNETADKISNLLPEGSLDDTTRMVLVNAIHLRMPWAYPFDVSATKPGTFTRGDGTTVTTSFMQSLQIMGFSYDDNVSTAWVPLSGGQLWVVIAVPQGDLATYEAGLTPDKPGALAPPANPMQVQLSLPKVTFASPSFSLAKELQAMGMVQPFDKRAADFKGLCASPPDGDNLYIADVLQKATLAMQETGVEAAGATGSLVSGDLATPPWMVVDSPYLVAIVDGPTGAILFLGHVQDPTDVGSP